MVKQESKSIRAKIQNAAVCCRLSHCLNGGMGTAQPPPAGEVAVHLLSRLLAFDPERRCSAEEALQHEYFSGLETTEDVDTSTPPPSTSHLQDTAYGEGCF